MIPAVLTILCSSSYAADMCKDVPVFLKDETGKGIHANLNEIGIDEAGTPVLSYINMGPQFSSSHQEQGKNLKVVLR